VTDTTAEVNEEASSYSQMGMQALLDLSNPQPNYKGLLEQGGFVQPAEAMALSFDRATPNSSCSITSCSPPTTR